MSGRLVIGVLMVGVAPLALALQPSAYLATQDHGLGGKEGLPRVVEYVVGGAVVLFALFVLDKIFEDSDEQPASVSLPAS